jgi:hypothetical protein
MAGKLQPLNCEIVIGPRAGGFNQAVIEARLSKSGGFCLTGRDLDRHSELCAWRKQDLSSLSTGAIRRRVDRLFVAGFRLAACEDIANVIPNYPAHLARSLRPAVKPLAGLGHLLGGAAFP